MRSEVLRRGVRSLGGLVALVAAASCSVATEAAPPAPEAHASALRRGNEQLEWFRVDNPPPRFHGGMTYDRARRRRVVIGGSDPFARRDVWERDTSLGWHERTDEVAGPRELGEHGLVYDERRQRSVLFGGRSAAGLPLRDLWEWDGFGWSSPSIDSGGPSARYGVAMAYDRARGRSVVFGGRTGAARSGELWEWDGESWFDRTEAGAPSARSHACMTYDAARSRMVLFGGLLGDDAASASAELWEWDGAAWHQPSVTGARPSARFHAAMAYDENRQRTVMFGGNTGSPSAELWEWDGTTWSDRTPPEGGPSARSAAQLTYDPEEHVVVLLGGGYHLPALGDEWSWDGSAWTAAARTEQYPTFRQHSALAYDSLRDTHVAFGGLTFDGTSNIVLEDTWERTAVGWTRAMPAHSPPRRYYASFAFDPARGNAVLFGGASIDDAGVTVRLGDTWLWNGIDWTEATSDVVPSARTAATLGYDPLRQRMVLFGGVAGSATAGEYSRETWEWDGVEWTDRTPVSGGPLGRSLATMAFDPAERRLLMFGGNSVSGTLDDLWAWDGNAWSPREGDGLRPQRELGALVTSGSRGSALLVSQAAVDTVGSRSQLWEWAGGRWEQLPLARPPSTLRDYAVAPTATDAMLFAGVGATINSYAWRLTTRGGPCTSAADSSTGFCVDGVACSSARCAPCETCASPDDSGRCVPLVSADDPDSCGPAERSTCDASGRCRLALGTTATNPADCVSGFVSDGVCCEVASCGACRTCNALEKEIRDNSGYCGTRRAGTDPHQDCAEEPASSCGRDGTCDGRGACRMHVAGTACAPVERSEARVSGAVCSGAGECLMLDASCDGDHQLLVPGAEPIDCGVYRCEGATCKSSCASVKDCASGFFCDDAGACVPPGAPSGASDGGCNCQLGSAPGRAAGTALLVGAVLLLLSRRGRRRPLLCGGGALLVTVAACGSDPPAMSSRTSQSAALSSAETLTWSHVGLPVPRYDAMTTYDPARGGLFVFGGTDGGPTFDDVFSDQWLYDGGGWVEQPLAGGIGPSLRSAGAMTYDRLRQRVLLYGGGVSPSVGYPPYDDLWQWDGRSWERLRPRGASPGFRYFPAFAYDETRDRAVLFGGAATSFYRDTWEWDGESWQDRTPPSGGPSPRSGSACVYDPARGRTVLFGGFDGADMLNDTWEWDGSVWTDVSALSAAPSGRMRMGSSYDRARSRMIVFGGNTPSGTSSQIWERDAAGTWANRTPGSGPLSRVGPAQGYDEARQRTVAFGGVRAGGVVLGDVWEWDGSIWSPRSPPPQPALRFSIASTFDLARERLLMFGGHDQDLLDARELWSWDGKAWTELTTAAGPGARHAAAFASGSSQVVLYGGYHDAGYLADLWHWDGASWTERTGAAGPGPRAWASMAFDAARERFLLFGGNSPAGLRGDTWQWDGTAWTERQLAVAPSPRSAAALSYDPEREVLVLFGGSGADGLSRELWEWNGAAWTDRTLPNDGPPPAPQVEAMYDSELHRTLLVLAPGTAYGQSSEVWAWDGSDWALLPVDVAPPVGSSFTLGYDSAHRRGVLHGAMRYGSATRGETWLLRSRGAACSSDADATTGHCVDGVSCEVAACPGVCESCANPGAAGRCSKVTLAADADTCSGAQICDRDGACKAVLGQAASQASQCASGYLVDGVCCETASCAACATCNAAQKEIADNSGRCGTQRAGIDLHDECAATPVSSCGLSGVCDGRGSCALHPLGTPCGAEGMDATCSGAGACVVQSAVCEDEGAVRAPNGKLTPCEGFRCVDGACLTRCATVNDCVQGSVCDPGGSCVPASSDGSAEPGCACTTAGSSSAPDWSSCLAALGLLLATRRRRRSSASAATTPGS